MLGCVQSGLTIIVIDKYIRRLIRFADHHAVLEKGQVVWRGPSQELAARQDIWSKYLSV